MDLNDLCELALSDASDDRIAHAFQQATLPPEFLGDLRDFIAQVRRAAGRALVQPAGGRPGPPLRRGLRHQDDPQQPAGSGRPVPAAGARPSSSSTRPPSSARRRTTSPASALDHGAEKMAVIIQEVVGRPPRRPLLSPALRRGAVLQLLPQRRGQAHRRRREPGPGPGQADRRRRRCPGPTRRPIRAAPPPFNDVGDRMRNTQTAFWAVNMGTPPPPDPMRETEYLLRGRPGRRRGRRRARPPGLDLRPRLRPAAPGLRPRRARGSWTSRPSWWARPCPSTTWCGELLRPGRARGRLPGGDRVRPGPRRPAATACASASCRCGRWPSRDGEDPGLAGGARAATGVVLAADRALGNGARDDLADIVYVKPEIFEARPHPRDRRGARGDQPPPRARGRGPTC